MKNRLLLSFLSLATAGLSLPLQADATCLEWADFSTDANTKMVTLNAPSNSHFSLKGQLIRRPLLTEEKSYWVGYQFYQPQVKVNGNAGSTNEYAVAFAAKISRASGDVIEYQFNAKLKPADKNKLISVHRALHLPKLPEKLATSSIVLEESDDLGVYQSEYKQLTDKQLQRKKLRYFPDTVKEKGGAVKGLMQLESVNIVSDEFKFERSKCWHEKVTGKSNIQVASRDKSIEIQVDQVLALAINDKPVPNDARLLQLPLNPKDWDKISADKIYPRPAANPLANEKAFLMALGNLDFVNGKREDILQFLYDNDKYLDKLLQLFAEKRLSDDAESKLFMYLGKHDSPNAHRLLTHVFLEENLTPNQRFRSLMALKSSQNPLSEDLVTNVFDYATTNQDGANRTLANSALMVMGAIAKNQENSEFANDLTKRMATALADNPSDHTTTALLSALGNSGDETHRPLVGSYLNADNTRIRSEAAATLGKMPSPEARDMLSHQLSEESNTKVKTNLLKALGQQDLTDKHLDTIFQYAKSSKDSDLRLAAIDALTGKTKNSDALKTQMKTLLKNENNQHNLRKIMKALYNQ